MQSQDLNASSGRSTTVLYEDVVLCAEVVSLHNEAPLTQSSCSPRIPVVLGFRSRLKSRPTA